jgi:hypothetical protein
VAIRKDKASALRSRYSAFAGGEQGAITGNVGDDVGPQPTKIGDPYAKFEQASPAGVRGRAHGSQHAGAPAHGDGSGPSFAAQKEPRGISPQEAAFVATKGNSPKRGPGRKTQAADIDKLKTAGQ